jgi:hypothetical protein
MEVELAPGRPSAPLLPAGATIGTARTSIPVPLSDLLSRLDGDTRDYLTGLIAAVDRGTHGRGPDLRRLLLGLAPTARQAGQISDALARRRTQLAGFVHNLARLTHAASQDGELAAVVTAGQQTLHAIATQDRPLRNAIAKLPGTLDAARGTLTRLTPFARVLRPTLDALLPSLHPLPGVLTDVGTFSERGADVLRNSVRPLVRSARPVIRDARIAVPALHDAAPPLTGVGQTLNYLLNELAFVPGGDDQGYLFWLAWFMHNMNSAITTGDANGAIVRAAIVVACGPIQDNKRLQAALAPLGVCPE